jgi:hypothetical protein
MDKFVKLAAIEQLAKPMEEFHGKDSAKSEYKEGGKDWECPECGTAVMATKDMEECECPCCECEMEPAEDTEEEDEEESEDED